MLSCVKKDCRFPKSKGINKDVGNQKLFGAFVNRKAS